MAIKWFDRVRDTGTTTGSGNVTVTGTAPSTYRSLNDVFSTNDEFIYSIAHRSANEFEVGVGKYAGSHAFSRNRILASSNAGAAVSLSAGTKDVFVVLPANWGARETLKADRTYYVSTTGADTLDGLSLTSALLTGQAAWNKACAIDCAGFNVTIQFGAGTFSGIISCTNPLLNCAGTTVPSAPDLVGADTSGSTILTASDNHTLSVGGATVNVKNVKLQNDKTGGGGNWACIIAGAGGQVNVDTGVIFGACQGTVATHCYALTGGSIFLDVPYSITGQANSHHYIAGGYLEEFATTITLSGVQAYTTFCLADTGGKYYGGYTSYTGGTITGKRYDVTLNAALQTFGSGANYFPGNAAGTTATGGQYV